MAWDFEALMLTEKKKSKQDRAYRLPYDRTEKSKKETKHDNEAH